VLVLLDAANVVRDFVLDEMGPLADVNTSYALSDTARFARPSWDAGAWGTQGSLLAEKLLSLGSPKHLKLVRRWLLNNPILPSGEVFSTEGGLLHMGADGKWEANAEFIIGAALYAKHGLDERRHLFHSVADRLVCAVDRTGRRMLLGGGGGGGGGGGDSLQLGDDVCAKGAAAGLAAKHPQLYATTMNAAYLAHTEGATLNASGTALFQNLSAKVPFVALSIPLRSYKPMRQPCWAATAVLYAVGDQEQQDQHQGRQLLPPVYSQEIVVTSHTLQWFDLTLDHALPAGRYRLELWPSTAGPGGREQGLFTSPAWLSNLKPVPPPRDHAAATTATSTTTDTSAWLAGGTLLFQPGVVAGHSSHSQSGAPAIWAQPGTLGERLSRAMEWQLGYLQAAGVMTIPQAHWRGVGADAVGASSAMWDLLRSGYRDAYLNVRMVESMHSLLELQDAGLVPRQVLTNEDLAKTKRAYVEVFGIRDHLPSRAGSYHSWIGCNAVGADGMSACGDDTGAFANNP
jgi:hypothetical protein